MAQDFIAHHPKPPPITHVEATPEQLEGFGHHNEVDGMKQYAEDIARSAGTGAIIGGMTAGLPGIITGGIGGAVGGAVSGAINSLLPDSEISHLVSNVAGGVVGGAAAPRIVSRFRARARGQQNRVNEEQQALLRPNSDDSAVSSLSASRPRSRGQGQRLGGSTGISSITNSPPRQQASSSTYNNMMTKAKEAGQYIEDTTEKTVEAIKGRMKKSGPKQVPKSDNISFEDALNETKTTPLKNFAIEETKPQTVGSNIHTH